MATATKPRLTLGALTPLLDVNELDDAPIAPRSEEAPRMALDLIDDSPTQPRQDYDQQTLQELADSIKAAGDVLQPVSLRPNPDAPGRYVLNFGHRRVRAARIAGLPDVPYFIGQQCDSFAQVVENEQRDNLSPLDLAAFIRDRMVEGMQQQEIARRLGKSKTYISKAASLNSAPAAVIEALQTGKLGGVTEAYELAKLHADHPQAVVQLVKESEQIPRAAIFALREQLEAPVVEASPPPAAGQVASAEPAVTAPAARVEKLDAPKPATAAPAPAAGQTAKPASAALVVLAEYKGQPLELDLTSRPAADGHFYGRRPGSPRRLTVPAAEVRLLGFVSE